MTTTTEAESDTVTRDQILRAVRENIDIWYSVDGERLVISNITDAVMARLTPPSLQPSPADDRGFDVMMTAITNGIGKLTGIDKASAVEEAEIVCAKIRREWELQGIALTEVQS